MQKIKLVYFLMSLLICNVSGQIDKQATDILDKFSSKALSSPSVTLKFLAVTIDQAENTRDTTEGSLVISKNNYRLEFPDNIVWFNGETSWSYLTAEKEVTITKPDKKDNSFFTRPSTIFTMYKDGYKSRLVEENASAYIIDLYPEDTANEIIRVRLTISRSSMALNNLEYKRRDGITIMFYIRDYNMKNIPEPGLFIFTPEKYRDAEIIDLR